MAAMDGLLLVSYFNQMRAQGMPLRESIMQGAEKRVRPVMMTALTAIFGLLPAAMSTRIGSQAQQPLAIVVVGGMIATLFLTRYLMPVLYCFYGHRERAAQGIRQHDSWRTRHEQVPVSPTRQRGKGPSLAGASGCFYSLPISFARPRHVG